MIDEKKSIIGFIIFFIFVILLAVGGYVYLKWDKTDETEKINESADKMKKNQKQDFIYFTDITPLSVEQEIIYKVPVINFDNLKVDEINEKLKNDMEEIKNHVVLLDSVSDEQKANALYTSDNIFSAYVRDYGVYEYKKYLSLVVKDYEYLCTGYNKEAKYTTYIFDKTTGLYLTETDILEQYEYSFTNVIDKIREKLNADQSVNEDGTSVINIDETMNDINNNIAIYVNKDGNLVVLFIVKSVNNNYNESIILEKK